MAKILVVIPSFLDKHPPARQLLLNEGYELIENEDRGMSADDWKDVLPDIDGIIVGGGGKWDEEVFKIAKNLKIIAKTGKGLDNIDCKKAREYGITVTNTGSANANGVAELTMGLMLACLRDIVAIHNSVVTGSFNMLYGTELKGKTIGLLGFGAIAQLVAKKAKAFDAEIIAYDPYFNKEAGDALGVKSVDLSQLYKNADIVSTHIPAMKETLHFVNAEAFSQMKDGVIFLNASRGTVCDEKALIDAVQSGKVGFVGLDVFETEPPAADNPLLKMPNVVCTSHVGGSTYQAAIADCTLTSTAIVDVLNGKTPQNLVN